LRRGRSAVTATPTTRISCFARTQRVRPNLNADIVEVGEYREIKQAAHRAVDAFLDEHPNLIDDRPHTIDFPLNIPKSAGAKRSILAVRCYRKDLGAKLWHRC
jgi:hypothetical protein